MPPENLKLYNVRVKPSVWQEARAIAEAQGDRISDVIRTLISEYVRKNRRLLEPKLRDAEPPEPEALEETEGHGTQPQPEQQSHRGEDQAAAADQQ